MEHFLSLPQIPQRTPEWFQKKSEILSSTQVASIIHLNSHRSYDQLLQKQPDLEPPEIPRITRRNAHDIDPITWGTVLESIAIQHLEQTTQKPVGPLGLKIHDQYPYLGASPDGIQIVNSQPRLIEIKCPKRRQITYRVPLEYWVQVQIAMEVWDIDQTLYCEYKFDITTESPTTRDLTLTYGELARGVYWIYHDSWTYLIERDREWFQRVQPQIERFYYLKFAPSDLSLSFESDSNEDNQQKRKHTQVSPQQRKKQKVRQRISYSHFSIKERIPVNKLSNFLRDDPIIDWLEIHGAEHGYEKEKSIFLDFYNQMNLQFKLNQIVLLLNKVKEHQLSYRVLNPSIDNLIDIYQNNLLLKIPYDLSLLEETQAAMEDQVQVIFMGQLAKEIRGHYLWDTFDVIVHRDSFGLIFKPEQESLIQLPDLSELTYIPIKIKLTTLKFLKRGSGVHLGSDHKVDQLKIGAITAALLMDRHQTLGVIPEHKKHKLMEDGLDWLQSVKDTSTIDSIYPNMKNHYDSQWKTAKSEIAREREELTQIRYLSVSIRGKLHNKGITKISQLTEEIVADYDKKIIPHIQQELYLPKLVVPPSTPTKHSVTDQPIEIYLDFEHSTSLGNTPSIIFLMGILVKIGDQDPEYHPYLVEHLNQESQTKMLSEGMHFLRMLRGKNIPVFHWSNAEPNLLSKAGWDLPSNCYWVDLHHHFVQNHASIPGCYTYGLKDVASSLYQMKMIQSHWLHGLDGNSAMTMACNINHKCEITGETFRDDLRIRKLCEYNYVDCIVMEEIRRLL